jgi:hypothetical protein
VVTKPLAKSRRMAAHFHCRQYSKLTAAPTPMHRCCPAPDVELSSRVWLRAEISARMIAAVGTDGGLRLPPSLCELRQTSPLNLPNEF